MISPWILLLVAIILVAVGTGVWVVMAKRAEQRPAREPGFSRHDGESAQHEGAEASEQYGSELAIPFSESDEPPAPGIVAPAPPKPESTVATSQEHPACEPECRQTDKGSGLVIVGDGPAENPPSDVGEPTDNIRTSPIATRDDLADTAGGDAQDLVDVAPAFGKDTSAKPDKQHDPRDHERPAASLARTTGVPAVVDDGELVGHECETPDSPVGDSSAPGAPQPPTKPDLPNGADEDRIGDEESKAPIRPAGESSQPDDVEAVPDASPRVEQQPGEGGRSEGHGKNGKVVGSAANVVSTASKETSTVPVTDVAKSVTVESTDQEAAPAVDNSQPPIADLPPVIDEMLGPPEIEQTSLAENVEEPSHDEASQAGIETKSRDGIKPKPITSRSDPTAPDSSTAIRDESAAPPVTSQEGEQSAEPSESTNTQIDLVREFPSSQTDDETQSDDDGGAKVEVDDDIQMGDVETVGPTSKPEPPTTDQPAPTLPRPQTEDEKRRSDFDEETFGSDEDAPVDDKADSLPMPSAARTRRPAKYRPSVRSAEKTRRTKSETPSQESNGTRVRSLPVSVRLIFSRSRRSRCRVSLLPSRAAGQDEEVEVTGPNGQEQWAACQDEWYGDVVPPNIEGFLWQGVSWCSVGDESQRWVLTGRDIWVLAQSPTGTINGFVSVPRLILQENHVVLCRQSLRETVREALANAGCSSVNEVSSAGLPAGWILFQEVQPTRAMHHEESAGIVNVLRPIHDLEIVFEGGIRLSHSNWLIGHPPRIRVRGSDHGADVLIDERPTSLDGSGAYTAQGWDTAGLHTVFCGGVAETYQLIKAPEDWDLFDAFVYCPSWETSNKQGLAVCGPLVKPTAENQVIAVTPAPNSCLLGPTPGQIAFSPSPYDLRAKEFVRSADFPIVWTLPANPLRSDKGQAFVGLSTLLCVNRDRVHLSRDRELLLRWCRAILDAARKGLRIDPDSAEARMLWSQYKQVARQLWKEFR